MMKQRMQMLKSKENRVICLMISALTLFYLYIFVLTPITMDRYYESFLDLKMQSSWRCVLMQGNWVLHSNLRILSNVFSIILDSNRYISAIAGAVMIAVWVSLAIRRISAPKLRVLVSFACIASVILASNAMWTEVFLCAKTLYLSCVLLVIVFVEWMVNYYEDFSIKYTIWLLIVGLFWHELVIFGMMAACVGTLVVKIVSGEIQRKDFIVTGISTSLVIIDYYHTKRLASFRMTDMHAPILGGLYQLMEHNLFIFLPILMVLIDAVKRVGQKWQKNCLLFISVLNLCTFVALFYKWLENQFLLIENKELLIALKIGNILYRACNKYYLFGLIMLDFGIIAYIGMKRELKDIVLLSVVAAGEFFVGSIFFTTMVRTQVLWLFFIPMLIQIIDIAQMKSDGVLKKSLVVLVFVVVLGRGIDMCRFVSDLHRIEAKNEMTIENVRRQQLLSKWDYSKEVTLYRYPISGDGKKIWYDEIYEDSRSHQYQSVLKHYRLNDNTRIVYQDV